MVSKDENNLYDTLAGGGVPASEEVFSLEEILAEYGGGIQQALLQESPQEEAPPPEEPSTEPPEGENPPSQEEPAGPALPPPESPPVKMPQIPPPVDPDVLEEGLPNPIPLEKIVEDTVDAVMEESSPPPPRRGLFSRRRIREVPPPPPPGLEEEEEPEEVLADPEPELFQAAASYKKEFRGCKSALPAAAVITLLPTLALLAEQYNVTVPYWTGEPRTQSFLLLACLGLVSLLCRHVYGKGVRMVMQGRCTSELLVSIAAVAAAMDCGARLVSNQRSDAMPYAPVCCLALVFALWGISRESRGMYDTFRTAAMDAPYLLTETQRGACKQLGSTPGFYTAATSDHGGTLWQTALLPVVLAASLVFAGLSSFGQDRGGDFLLNLSAILSAGATFAWSLCWGLPFSHLAEHLQKTGSAVAGWLGAEKLSRRRCMILTDMDLFPPGAVQLNGVKLFGEDLVKAASYAATMARAAHSGLEWVFDGLLRSELGEYEEVEDFGFYEEGGWTGIIHGETVLMGTAAFLRRMNVRIPDNLHLKTGIFLSVDRQLSAVFAVKYDAVENVDFALEMMARNHVTPILASRDPNIGPGLLRRKFRRVIKVEFPTLTDRVALSEAERDRGLPRALVLREGLLPFAETVAGSRRLCGAVHRACAVCTLGSAAGTLLAFYLVFLGSYSLLTPLALDAFLLLWTLPVLLIADWAGRY